MVTFLTVSKPPPSLLPVQQSFTQKLLKFTITLDPNPGNNQPTTFQGTGVPGADGTNQVTLAGVRASARIENNGAPAGSRASVAIWGLTPSLMNQLATLGPVYNSYARNTILVSAGDDVSGVAPVLFGTITHAYADYSAAPDVPFRIESQSATIDAVASAQPSSFKGPVDVANIMAGLARQMNLGFINNGVSVMRPSVYLRGNLETQVRQLADWAHIKAERVLGGGTLAIWKIGSSWQGPGTVFPLVSPDTGMIGYPALSQFGPIVRMLFNPQVAFGGMIRLVSSIPQANATWYVQGIDLALDTLVPHGKWEATVRCNGTYSALPTPPAP